jgi:hypothetical protein
MLYPDIDDLGQDMARHEGVPEACCALLPLLCAFEEVFVRDAEMERHCSKYSSRRLLLLGMYHGTLKIRMYVDLEVVCYHGSCSTLHHTKVAK